MSVDLLAGVAGFDAVVVYCCLILMCLFKI